MGTKSCLLSQKEGIRAQSYLFTQREGTGNSVLPPHLEGKDGNSVLPPHSEGRSSGCTAGSSTNTASTGHSPAIWGAIKALTPSTGSRLCTLGELASREGSTWWIHTTCKAIIDDTGVQTITDTRLPDPIQHMFMYLYSASLTYSCMYFYIVVFKHYS